MSEVASFLKDILSVYDISDVYEYLYEESDEVHVGQESEIHYKYGYSKTPIISKISNRYVRWSRAEYYIDKVAEDYWYAHEFDCEEWRFVDESDLPKKVKTKEQIILEIWQMAIEESKPGCSYGVCFTPETPEDSPAWASTFDELPAKVKELIESL